VCEQIKCATCGLHYEAMQSMPNKLTHHALKSINHSWLWFMEIRAWLEDAWSLEHAGKLAIVQVS